MTDYFHDTATGVDVHTPIAFTFANSAARGSATNPNTSLPYTSADLYKFARQSDENSVWMLTAITPTWIESGGTAASAGSGLTKDGDGVFSLGGSLTGDAILTPDADGSHTVNLGASSSSRIDTFNVFAETYAGLQSGALNDRSFMAMFGTVIKGMELGYFLNETSLMGLRINLSNDGNFEVVDQINTKGMIYAADYSANYTDRSLVDKGYVDGLVGNGSIYEASGTLTGNRTVTGNSSHDLTFLHYNGTSSTYTLRSEIKLEDTDLTFGAYLGDGFGADLSSTTLSLANTGLSISTGVGNTEVLLRTNDWEFYEGSSNTSTNVLTVHGDGNHSSFDPYVTLHEGFATGNGTNAQDLVVNYGKGVKVKFNDGTRSVNVFSIKSVVNASQVFQHMEHDYSGVQQDFLNIRALNWYFDTTGSPLWTIYDDDAGTNTLFTLDNSGNLTINNGDLRVAAGSTANDQWRIDGGSSNDNLRLKYYDDSAGTTTVRMVLDSSGNMDLDGDITVNEDTAAPLVPPYASQILGAATDITVTTTEQTVTLDTAQIDGSGSEYTINLANNRVDLGGADGSKVYLVTYAARFLLTSQGTTGSSRSFARIKARLDAVDVAWSEQWAYIREWQGGTNGDPSTGMAMSFLIQPAANDQLDFRVYGTTDTGSITDFDLSDFGVTIQRVA